MRLAFDWNLHQSADMFKLGVAIRVLAPSLVCIARKKLITLPSVRRLLTDDVSFRRQRFGKMPLAFTNP
jgi:hypothetical protein